MSGTDSRFQLFDYEDVLLLPRFSDVHSRRECSTNVVLGPHTFKLPVIPANMKTVINEELCAKLARGGYFYVMHRFEVDRLAFAERFRAAGLFISISIGVKKEDYTLVRELAARDLIPEYITVDVAHGHSVLMRDMLKFLKMIVPTSFVIAGNVATPNAVMDLEAWGADATKIGVGPGAVCITRLKTGFGTGGWQLSAVKWCSSAASKPVIADGGIRHHGDIAKSIRFGATMVMVGSLFASRADAPGTTIEKDGKLYKEYYGSASEFNKGIAKNIEGKRILTEINGTYDSILAELREDLQSSISYGGGRDLSALPCCDYIILGGINKREDVFGQTKARSDSMSKKSLNSCDAASLSLERSLFT